MEGHPARYLVRCRVIMALMIGRRSAAADVADAIIQLRRRIQTTRLLIVMIWLMRHLLRQITVVELPLLAQILMAVRVHQIVIRRLVLRQRPAALALLIWQDEPATRVVVVRDRN